jgi:hypothetical protein
MSRGLTWAIGVFASALGFRTPDRRLIFWLSPQGFERYVLFFFSGTGGKSTEGVGFPSKLSNA